MASVKCGQCKKTHTSVSAVRQCYTDARGGYLRAEDAIAASAEEVRAENAWLQAAEAGNPDTWRENELERMAEASGLPVPPGLY